MANSADPFNESDTLKALSACGNLYVTVVWTKDKDKQVKNVFCHMGKAGGCAGGHFDSHSQAVKKMIRARVPINQVAQIYVGATCHEATEERPCCLDAFGKLIQKIIEVKGE